MVEGFGSGICMAGTHPCVQERDCDSERTGGVAFLSRSGEEPR